jgi:hypothetical protein
MDLKTLAKQYQEKLRGPKEPPEGHASVAMIAAALEVTVGKITNVLARSQVKRAGTVAKSTSGPGYAYYDLEQVAMALGLRVEPKQEREG